MAAPPQPGKTHYSYDELSTILENKATSAREMQKFIDGGLDCDQHFGYEGSLLTLAIESGDRAVVEQLLAHGASANAAAGFAGMRPLHWAADEGDVPIARALVDAGANVQESRALLVAAANLRTEMIRYLLEVHAPLEDRYAPGELGARSDDAPGEGTPLHAAVRASYAAAQGHADVLDGPRHLDAVRTLLAAGADVTAKDSKGLTPRQAAEDAKFEKVAALLREHE